MHRRNLACTRYNVDVGGKLTRGAATWKDKLPAIALVASFATTLAVIALLNFLVNPFAIYPTNLVDRTEGNFRKKKHTLLKRFSYEPDTVILGSSRAMTMRPDDVMMRIPSMCFNFAAPSCTAEDYYATMMVLTDDLGCSINTVVLAVDYEAFNPAEPLQSEIRFFPKYARYLTLTPGTTANTAEKLALLFSYEQTDESLKAISRTIRKKSGVTKIQIRRDGWAMQIEREKEIAAGTFDLEKIMKKRIRKYPERSLKLSKYTGLDDRRLKYLDMFFELCREQNVKVYAYITPYHPELWTVLQSHPNGAMLDRVKAELTARFAEQGITLHDYSHIESFGGDPARFYDEIHPMPDTQAKILDALFASEGVLRKSPAESGDVPAAKDSPIADESLAPQNGQAKNATMPRGDE
jgi:hypothetical protein